MFGTEHLTLLKCTIGQYSQAASEPTQLRVRLAKSQQVSHVTASRSFERVAPGRCLHDSVIDT
jgi:hypothetical protein